MVYNGCTMTPEKIPAIHPNKHFPIGDVIMDAHRQKKVNDWFERVEDMEMEEYMGHVRLYHAPQSMDGEKAYATHEAAVRLCRSWDRARAKALPLAEVGYRLAMTFNRQALLLPKCDVDLTLELKQMREQQQHLAYEFAEFAWEGMAMYPNVRSCYERLLAIGRRRFGLDDETDRHYFQAGMALPYVFAWTSRLEGYTPAFSGMTDKKYDPEDDDFKRHFTN